MHHATHFCIPTDALTVARATGMEPGQSDLLHLSTLAAEPTGQGQHSPIHLCPMGKHCWLPNHFSASKLIFLSFRIELIACILKPVQNSIFSQVSPASRDSPFRPPTRAFAHGPHQGHSPRPHSCPATLNDLPPPMIHTHAGCLLGHSVQSDVSPEKNVS